MRDFYAGSAEYIDIMSRQAWDFLGPVLAGALEGTDRGGGPVVDVGAGTGLGTEVIARTLPETEILAVEPSPGLRGVLLSRLVSSDDLLRRVTVLPCDLASAQLPERLGAAVAMNMLDHLEPDERRAFWALLAQRLAPGGRAVVNLIPDPDPEQPAEQFSALTIGGHHYEGWGRAERTGPDTLLWHMTYRVVDGTHVIRTATVDYQWWRLSEAQLVEELAAQHLTLTLTGPPDAGIYTISRPIA